MIPQCSNHGVWNDLGISYKYLNGQRSWLHGHKVQKHIEDNRVAGVKYIIIIIKNEKIRVTLCENAAGALYIVNNI